MKNKILVLISVVTVSFFSCNKDDFTPSTVVSTSIPVIAVEMAQPSYVFGIGEGDIFNTIPDTIAIAVDSLYGFENGFGGKTGKDSAYILKSQLTGGWPDTTAVGAYSLHFESPYNNINYKTPYNINIVVAGPIDNPGPTDISGHYIRTSNNFGIDIVKVFDGVYVIDNPGGSGAVASNPYLLYNYNSSVDDDSLVFPTQTDLCGGGLKLVAPMAPLGLTSAEYDASYPPAIVSSNPLVLSWIVLEFEDTDPGTPNPSEALCSWGTGLRTFKKK